MQFIDIAGLAAQETLFYQHSNAALQQHTVTWRGKEKQKEGTK